MSLQGAVNTLVTGVKGTVNDVVGLGTTTGNGIADGMDIAAGIVCKGLSVPGAMTRRITNTIGGFFSELM